MNITITGTITDIFDEEIFGNFSKRVFWVKEDAEKYPNHYELQMNQDKCNVLNNYSKGDKITCTADVKGRHYAKNGKEGCINSLVCWKIEKIADPQQQKREATKNFYGPINPAVSNEPVDDLPF
jgi:hypothetical protein